MTCSRAIAVAFVLLVCSSPAYAWRFLCTLPNLEIAGPAGVTFDGVGVYNVPTDQPLMLRAVPVNGQVYDWFGVLDYDEGGYNEYTFNSDYVLILPTVGNYTQDLQAYGMRSVDPPPPTDTGEDDMTDPQMTQFFTNMSTQTQKLVASNASVTDVVSMAQYAICGFIAALTCAVTWKG